MHFRLRLEVGHQRLRFPQARSERSRLLAQTRRLFFSRRLSFFTLLRLVGDLRERLRRGDARRLRLGGSLLQPRLLVAQRASLPRLSLERRDGLGVRHGDGEPRLGVLQSRAQIRELALACDFGVRQALLQHEHSGVGLLHLALGAPSLHRQRGFLRGELRERLRRSGVALRRRGLLRRELRLGARRRRGARGERAEGRVFRLLPLSEPALEHRERLRGFPLQHPGLLQLAAQRHQLRRQGLRLRVSRECHSLRGERLGGGFGGDGGFQPRRQQSAPALVRREIGVLLREKESEARDLVRPLLRGARLLVENHANATLELGAQRRDQLPVGTWSRRVGVGVGVGVVGGGDAREFLFALFSRQVCLEARHATAQVLRLALGGVARLARGVSLRERRRGLRLEPPLARLGGRRGGARDARRLSLRRRASLRRFGERRARLGDERLERAHFAERRLQVKAFLFVRNVFFFRSGPALRFDQRGFELGDARSRRALRRRRLLRRRLHELERGARLGEVRARQRQLAFQRGRGGRRQRGLGGASRGGLGFRRAQLGARQGVARRRRLGNRRVPRRLRRRERGASRREVPLEPRPLLLGGGGARVRLGLDRRDPSQSLRRLRLRRLGARLRRKQGGARRLEPRLRLRRLRTQRPRLALRLLLLRDGVRERASRALEFYRVRFRGGVRRGARGIELAFGFALRRLQPRRSRSLRLGGALGLGDGDGELGAQTLRLHRRRRRRLRRANRFVFELGEPRAKRLLARRRRVSRLGEVGPSLGESVLQRAQTRLEPRRRRLRVRQARLGLRQRRFDASRGGELRLDGVQRRPHLERGVHGLLGELGGVGRFGKRRRFGLVDRVEERTEAARERLRVAALARGAARVHRGVRGGAEKGADARQRRRRRFGLFVVALFCLAKTSVGIPLRLRLRLGVGDGPSRRRGLLREQTFQARHLRAEGLGLRDELGGGSRRVGVARRHRRRARVLCSRLGGGGFGGDASLGLRLRPRLEPRELGARPLLRSLGFVLLFLLGFPERQPRRFQLRREFLSESLGGVLLLLRGARRGARLFQKRARLKVFGAKRLRRERARLARLLERPRLRLETPTLRLRRQKLRLERAFRRVALRELRLSLGEAPLRRLRRRARRCKRRLGGVGGGARLLFPLARRPRVARRGFLGFRQSLLQRARGRVAPCLLGDAATGQKSLRAGRARSALGARLRGARVGGFQTRLRGFQRLAQSGGLGVALLVLFESSRGLGFEVLRARLRGDSRLARRAHFPLGARRRGARGGELGFQRRRLPRGDADGVQRIGNFSQRRRLAVRLVAGAVLWFRGERCELARARRHQHLETTRQRLSLRVRSVRRRARVRPDVVAGDARRETFAAAREPPEKRSRPLGERARGGRRLLGFAPERGGVAFARVKRRLAARQSGGQPTRLVTHGGGDALGRLERRRRLVPRGLFARGSLPRAALKVGARRLRRLGVGARGFQLGAERVHPRLLLGGEYLRRGRGGLRGGGVARGGSLPRRLELGGDRVPLRRRAFVRRARRLELLRRRLRGALRFRPRVVGGALERVQAVEQGSLDARRGPRLGGFAPQLRRQTAKHVRRDAQSRVAHFSRVRCVRDARLGVGEPRSRLRLGVPRRFGLRLGFAFERLELASGLRRLRLGALATLARVDERQLGRLERRRGSRERGRARVELGAQAPGFRLPAPPLLLGGARNFFQPRLGGFELGDAAL